MNEYGIQKDIPVWCVKAASFPDGVLQAFRHIEQAGPEICNRNFYGLSHGNRSGGIDYWAAVEQMPGDEPQLKGFEKKTLPAGRYASITVTDFRKNISAIGDAFKTLLHHPDMDRAGNCIEIYKNDTVICLVRLR